MDRFDEFYAPMAEILGLTEDEVERAARYCRKARLIAAGKPGPGGGAAFADLEGLANLTIGIVATDARMGAGRTAPQYIGLKRVGPRTGWIRSGTFGGDLLAALAMPSIARRIAEVIVTREPEPGAAIFFNEARDDGAIEQRYTVTGEAADAPAIAHQIRLDGRAVHSLSLVWHDLPRTPAAARARTRKDEQAAVHAE